MRSRWLLAAALAATNLGAQVLPQPPAVARIQQYVSRVDADKLLAIAQAYHEALNRPSTLPYPVLSIDGSIFSPYSTDFPCSALLYHSAAELTKVKEVISISSGFAVNYYYLKNNRLVFIEAKEVARPFGKQSPKIKYTEKDYTFHGKCFFVGDSCIYSRQQGEIRFSDVYLRGYGSIDSLYRHSTQPRAVFYRWQASRYLTILKRGTPE